MPKFWWNTKSIISVFSSILVTFKQYEILLSLECAVDSEWNDVITFVVSCSVELFTWRNHKNPVFTLQHQFVVYQIQLCSGTWSILQLNMNPCNTHTHIHTNTHTHTHTHTRTHTTHTHTRTHTHAHTLQMQFQVHNLLTNLTDFLK